MLVAPMLMMGRNARKAIKASESSRRMERARDLGYNKDVFHSTNQDFDEIDTSKVDIGFHVGTKEQANNRSKNLQKEKLGLPFESDATFENKGIPLHREGSNIMPLKLRTSGEVLELPDIGNWDNSTFVARALAENRGGNVPKQLQDRAFAISELIEDFMETDEAFELAMDINKWTASPQNRGLLDELNTLIRDEGFSTIKYSNQYENTFLSKAAPRQEIVNRIDNLSEELATVSDPIKRADIETRINTARQEAMDSQVNDAFSYIVLDPSDVRSTSAAFKDGESKNILAGATSIGLGTVFTAAALAPQDAEAGFFSQAVKAAQNLTRKTGNAQGFKNDLTGKGQVKPDELKAMGFDEHFGDRKDITKEEVQQFINENQVQIKETLLSNAEGYRRGTKFGKYTLEGGDNYRELLLQDNSSAGLLDELNSLNNQMGEIKTPLLRNVTSDDALKKRYSDATIFGDMEIDEFVANEIPEYAALLSRRDELVRQKDNLPEPFINSSHFDEPNILAHLRMKDRVDADGNKTLLIEEAQSDWHQKGNDVGYNISQKQIDKLREKRDLLATKRKELDLEDADYLTNNPNEHRSPDEFMDRSSDNYKALLNAQFNLDTALDIEKVPDAPFKTDDKSSWYNLAMKRGLIEAAEGDYDKLAITTGRQQAERYDLSKTIGSLKYQEDMVEGRPVNILTAYDKQGMRVFNRRIDDPEKELPSIIGKDETKSLLEVEPYTPPQETRSIRSLRGQELSVGGEGMKEFYDRKLPNTLNKLVKQDGVKVGQSGLLKGDNVEIHQVIDDIDEKIDWLNVKNQVENYGSENPAVLAKYDAFVSKYKPKTITTDTVHSIDITPEMRDRVKKGLPLFAQGGLAVGGGALFAPKDLQAAEMPNYTSLYDSSVSVGNTMDKELAQQKANMTPKELSDYNLNNILAEDAHLRKMGFASYGKVSPELAAYRRGSIIPSIEEIGKQIKLNAAGYLDAISSGNMNYTGLPDYEFSKAQGLIDNLPKYREPTIRKAVEPMLKERIDPRDKRLLKDTKFIADMIF